MRSAARIRRSGHPAYRDIGGVPMTTKFRVGDHVSWNSQAGYVYKGSALTKTKKS